MLKEAIEKIETMAQPATYNINGDTYCREHLHRIEPHVDRPVRFHVSGLDSICKLIREEYNFLNSTLIVSVDSYSRVTVYTSLLDDLSRDEIYRAEADVPGFREGYRNAEEAIIQLRSLFHPNEGTEYLLNLLSRIDVSEGVTSADNGVTQTVTARQGVSLKEKVAINPRVNLQPFRTFLEVDQPESEFLLRVNDSGNVGLFEADGGVWKLEAKRNIAAYFEAALEDFVEKGLVVICY